MNGTSANVSWSGLSLEEARGFPLYFVHWTRSRPGHVAMTTRREWQQQEEAMTPETTIVIRGLLPAVEYTVTVTAASRSGELRGPPSDVLRLPPEGKVLGTLQFGLAVHFQPQSASFYHHTTLFLLCSHRVWSDHICKWLQSLHLMAADCLGDRRRRGVPDGHSGPARGMLLLKEVSSHAHILYAHHTCTPGHTYARLAHRHTCGVHVPQ